jgi:precorrin-8X/cobalt-precorrin-8 methylmutase
MARVGIRKKDAENFGCRVKCFMDDPDVIQKAARNNTTRAAAAVDAAVKDMAHGIYAVGNAPTALLHLMELIRRGSATPALVIGLPVGFVNAAESKEMLASMDFPHITNKGRKGGSTLAVAVVNALLLLASEKGT